MCPKTWALELSVHARIALVLDPTAWLIWNSKSQGLRMCHVPFQEGSLSLPISSVLQTQNSSGCEPLTLQCK